MPWVAIREVLAKSLCGARQAIAAGDSTEMPCDSKHEDVIKQFIFDIQKIVAIEHKLC